MVKTNAETALALFTGSSGTIVSQRGTPLAARTRRAYGMDLRQVIEILADGALIDAEREQAALRARADWAMADRRTRSSIPPSHPGSVLDRFFRLDTMGVSRIVTELSGRFAPATAARKLAALRTIWRTVREMGLVEGSPFNGAKQIEFTVQPVTPVPASVWVALVAIEPAQVVARARSNGGEWGRNFEGLILRDFAILLLFMIEGLRSGDLLEVTQDDYTAPTAAAAGKLAVRGRHGQLSRARTLALHPSTSRALNAYIAALQSVADRGIGDGGLVRQAAARLLFLNKVGEDLSSRSMRRKLRVLLRRIGFPEASPSRLRQTGIVDALASGVTEVDARIRFGFVPTFSFSRFRPCVSAWRDAKLAAGAATIERDATTSDPLAKRGQPNVVVVRSAPLTLANPPISTTPPNGRAPSPFGKARSLLDGNP